MAFTMAMFVQVAAYFSSAATTLAVFANAQLLFLVRTASPDEFGNYPLLMYANSFNLLLFSLIHAFAQPIISIEKTVVYVFTAKNYLNLPKIAMRFSLAAYGATYCMTLVLCAVMFVFRFNRVCRKEDKYFDSTAKILLWYVFIVVVGFHWGFCIFFLAQETPYVDAIISSSLTEYYGMNLSDVTYVAAVYELQDPINGTVTYNWKSVFMGASFLTIIGSSMLVTALCVYYISTQYKELTVAESVQRQMFRAQCVQTTLPFGLVCVPIFGVLLFPLFHFNGNVAFSCVSILVSIYPVLDPIAMILLISQYRERLCGKKHHK